MFFKQIFDKKLAQYSYLIGCQTTAEAIVIDPLRDIDQYHELAEREHLKITSAADTHIHADYVSGLREFAEKGVTIYASDEGGSEWKYEWLNNSGYDYHLIADNDRYNIGNIRFDVRHTPGHTPESLSFLVTDGAIADQPMGILTGDFVFVGDVGRPDLLETAAGQKGAMKPAGRQLYQSVLQFKKLPEYLQVWPAHGAGSACGKAMGAVSQSTVGYELRFSPAIQAAGSEQEFVDYILDGQPEPPLYFSRMKKVNKEGAEVLGSLPKPEIVSIDEMLKAKAEIIDTRGRHEFMKAHLPKALAAPFDHNFNTVAGSYVNPDADIFLLIEEEHVEEAVRDLIRVGLDHIRGYITPEAMHQYSGKMQAIDAVSFADVADRMNDTGIEILDVRKATEYAGGHVPGAKNIAHTRLARHLDELPKDKEWWVHCGTGLRASYATGLLAKNGFDVRWVDDNFGNWDKSNRSN